MFNILKIDSYRDGGTISIKCMMAVAWKEGTDGYYKTFRNYQDATEYYKEYYNTYYMSVDPYEESEEDKMVRLAREKAIERNKRIDSILV